MLSSILLRAMPDDVRLVLVDPKQVELNHYEAIPHLLTPVITSPRMAANALQNLVKEMEWRYGVMSVKRTRSLVELNKLRVREGEKPLPYILCLLGELADRLARDPRPERRRVAPRPGRHAVLAGRLVAAAAHPGRLHRRAPDRGADELLGPPGRARAARGPARGGRARGGREGRGGGLRPRRGSAARRRDRARRRDGH